MLLDYQWLQDKNDTMLPPISEELEELRLYPKVLRKYIGHVKACEGTDFVPTNIFDNMRHTPCRFNTKELEILHKMQLLANGGV